MGKQVFLVFSNVLKNSKLHSQFSKYFQIEIKKLTEIEIWKKKERNPNPIKIGRFPRKSIRKRIENSLFADLSKTWSYPQWFTEDGAVLALCPNYKIIRFKVLTRDPVSTKAKATCLFKAFLEVSRNLAAYLKFTLFIHFSHLQVNKYTLLLRLIPPL